MGERRPVAGGGQARAQTRPRRPQVMPETTHADQSVKVRHLPYAVDPTTNRFHFHENHWKRVGLELLLRHGQPQGMTVLDYGCGRGETLEIFAAAGFAVTGTDIDPECVRLASRFGPCQQLNAGEPLDQFGARSFDVVTCFHVLEHVPSPIKTLGQLAQMARRYVVVAVPNLRRLNGMFERRFALEHINEGHLQSWDHWHLRNLAERHCGLHLVAWGSDATMLPMVSELCNRLLGPRLTVHLECGLFRRLFPYHCISVLGLFRV